jgi:hypothetical protein
VDVVQERAEVLRLYVLGQGNQTSSRVDEA